MKLMIRPLSAEELADYPKFNNINALHGSPVSELKNRVDDILEQGEDAYNRTINVLDALKGKTAQNTSNPQTFVPEKKSGMGLLVGAAGVIGSIILIKTMLG